MVIDGPASAHRAPFEGPTMAEIEAGLTAPGAPFELVDVDVSGIRLRAWKNAATSLRSLLELSRTFGDQPFIVHEDDVVTFEKHFRAAAHLATVLVDRYGLRKGDRVAVAMRNRPEWSIAFWAAAAAGAVVVPLNAWWTGPELRYGLADSGATVAFVDAERNGRLAGLLADLDVSVVVVNDRPESLRDSGSGREVRWADLVADRSVDAELPAVGLDPDDPATIFYTSGTTGRPKGALGTHRNICGNPVSVAYAAERSRLRSGRPVPDPDARAVGLLSVPFFHATGCHSGLVTHLARGSTLVLMRRWNPERALELIERERVTVFGGVPAMVWQVLQSPALATRDTSSVLSIGYGGAPAPPELVRRLEQLFPGRSSSNGYGLTETSALTTSNAGVDYQRRPGSVGVPVPVVDLRVVDADGNDVPTGEVGELWIRGPNVVRGYWGRPDETSATFGGGWLRSGDIARIDDEGFVYVVDRAKDMIIRGGENVYCAEVEAALFEHPDVADAAVLGLADQVLGEEVAAVVVARAGATLTADGIRAHVAARLAAFNVPAYVFLRSEPLPRNPAGKVLKRDLRDEIRAGLSGPGPTVSSAPDGPARRS